MWLFLLAFLAGELEKTGVRGHVVEIRSPQHQALNLGEAEVAGDVVALVVGEAEQHAVAGQRLMIAGDLPQRRRRLLSRPSSSSHSTKRRPGLSGG